MNKALDEAGKEDSYEYAWDNWRLIQLAHWGLVIAFLPAIAVFDYLFGNFIRQIIAALRAIAWLVVGVLKYNWRCPPTGVGK